MTPTTPIALLRQVTGDIGLQLADATADDKETLSIPNNHVHNDRGRVRAESRRLVLRAACLWRIRDERKVANLLRNPVLEQLKIGSPEIGHRTAPLVAHDDVNGDCGGSRLETRIALFLRSGCKTRQHCRRDGAT